MSEAVHYAELYKKIEEGLDPETVAEPDRAMARMFAATIRDRIINPPSPPPPPEPERMSHSEIYELVRDQIGEGGGPELGSMNSDLCMRFTVKLPAISDLSADLHPKDKKIFDQMKAELLADREKLTVEQRRAKHRRRVGQFRSQRERFGSTTSFSFAKPGSFTSFAL